MRNLTNTEIDTLLAAGCTAQNWQNVVVAEDFDTTNIRGCRFEGRVEIQSGVTLADSTIINYHIGAGATVISTLRMECRENTSFGNGVRVAAVNENGGRSVAIYDNLSAQTAYVAAMYRHRVDVVEAITNYAESYAKSVTSSMGMVSAGAMIIGARFIREAKIGRGVRIEGASLIENVTIADGCYVGVDVKLADSIVAEDAKIDKGAVVERCFVGERAILSNNFTAVDTLIFASSHFENGEACSVFAGPYTVSHHKSSLLIAGIFSFFNAGSGTNQSNHLFKCGAVHQAVHRRGCKFASNGYVMAPAAEGEFTLVIGRHTKHHNTSAMPFSYLIENDGISTLLPGFALRSYGTVRDIEKWQQRDKRTVKRDIISYNEYNPLLAGRVLEAIKTIRSLQNHNPEGEYYHYNNTIIKSSMAVRGLSIYGQYITASIGAMLSVGNSEATKVTSWVDLAGQYVDKEILNTLLDNFTTPEAFEAQLREFADNYDNAAHGWALAALENALGRRATEQDIATAITEGEKAQALMQRVTENDRQSDASRAMMAGYGIDSETAEEIMADFAQVRGL